ncbi:MAG: ATP-binding protein [Burkholderiales bacterium]
MTPDEPLDVMKIYSVAGLLGNRSGIVNARPFRFPHHTISQTALSAPSGEHWHHRCAHKGRDTRIRGPRVTP